MSALGRREASGCCVWLTGATCNIKKKISAYDSGILIGGSHKKPNEVIKTSLESIRGENWQTEQVQVPQQDEGESCGYKMLSYLNKVVKGQINSARTGKGPKQTLLLPRDSTNFKR